MIEAPTETRAKKLQRQRQLDHSEPIEQSEQELVRPLRAPKPIPVLDDAAVTVKREQRSQKLLKRSASVTGTVTAEQLQQAAVGADDGSIEEWERDNFPSRFFVPNIGQENAIIPLKTLDLNTDRVTIGCFTGGNGVGKTTILANLLVGICLGPQQMNPFFHDWKVFKKFDDVRQSEKRHVKVRLICHKNAMQEDGGLYQEILKWFPKGWMTWSKNHSSYFSSCEVKHPVTGKLMATIQVRTFDQETRAHAGDSLDAILCDEPMPSHLFNENASRLRNKRGGILWFFCTPLDVGGWMKDWLEDDPNVVFTSASIWDNCADWHPDPIRWSGGAVGVGEVLTRGHLQRSVIDDLKRQWLKEGYEVALSREMGKFTHLAGAVLKEFSPEVHVRQAFPIPAHWPIYCVMDPSNGGKPNFIAWFAQSDDDILYQVAEHPGMRWDSVTQGESVEQACRAIREVEARFVNQVVHRFADPALFKFQNLSGREVKPLGALFAEQGYLFKIANNDPGIGMSKLRERMFFEKSQGYDPRTNSPKMFFFDTNPWTGRPNENVIAACSQWTYKKGMENKSDASFTATVSDKWKDPIDVCRYLVCEVRPYRKVERNTQQYVPPKRINRRARQW